MGLLDLKNPFKKENEAALAEEPVEKVKHITYRQHGADMAQAQDGNPEKLGHCLVSICEQIQREIAENEREQEKRRIPIRAKINELEAALKTKNDALEAEKGEKKRKEQDIENAKQEILDVKLGKIKLTDEKPSKAGFLIGCVIIFCLTVYLFTFYSSAAYSAFFKNFTSNDRNVAQAIFDGQALVKAWGDGFFELLFIGTVPFVFLGLGYLIYKFGTEKGRMKYAKIAALIAITFVFDSLLAYEITEKIYNIIRGNSFSDMPEFSFSLAFSSVNFWIIIFAGFIVYLIWGFVFDFVMAEYEKFDVVRTRIQYLKDEIERLKKRCNEIDAKIKNLKDEINRTDAEMRNQKSLLTRLVCYFSDIYERLADFMIGWHSYLTFRRKPQEVVDHCNNVYNKFVENERKKFSVETKQETIQKQLAS